MPSTSLNTAVRTALITGSTDPQAIGFTAARLLALEHNFNIVLSGRRGEAVDQAVKKLSSDLDSASSSAKVFGLVLNVDDKASIDSAVDQLSSATGPLSGGALDVLINNAGVGAPPGRGGKGTNNMFLQTELTTAEDMVSVLTTNVAAPVAVTNALLPLLAKSDRPRIVNISSARGSIAFGSGLEPARTGAMVYNTSKTALNMVTLMQSKNLVQHTKTNLKVNAASPGHVKTPFNNFTGLRTLEQGAAVYVHLATLDDDGPSGQLIGNHAPFSSDGEFVQIPW
ncbi:NADP-dependent L-serine/L-allo-threonine dehydrogenase ydfG [Pseudozyma hubeiensis SY62]|uniref:NADP-dependent L-serine/L-allo-threonine dehydrogenase ydfG n=1 Tax=Pseudozyma hubeiensis (strain SY62) TaxID=1305764 RepID=R9PA68_PSEHS|nr:NADP-dependent L-serine/L-allo-threonine dehydrogenase ydfG [Pseudozyma hubeiensis SY62]GAC98244.1 NADP-dependent L-serine/L-allo-threonine dehydrogenase ydfG [Pseudozyma hubeiensis SY62]